MPFGTLNNVPEILGLLNQSLEAALVAGIIMRNPAQGVPRPSLTVGGSRERRALTEEEVGKLISAADGTPYAVAIRLALATGTRQSELLGARWRDIDLDRRTFVVSQTLQHVAGEFQMLPPKTRNSRRVIELSAATVALLRRHKLTQNEERLRLGTIWQPAPTSSPRLGWSTTAGRP